MVPDAHSLAELGDYVDVYVWRSRTQWGLYTLGVTVASALSPQEILHVSAIYIFIYFIMGGSGDLPEVHVDRLL